MSNQRKILINYADQQYKKTQHFNSWTGKHIAHFDEVIEYDPKCIDKSFKEKYKKTLSVKRGAGLWLWKPYIILKTLNQIKNGDYVFYCDSGAFFVRNINWLIKSMGEKDIWVSDTALIEKQWTKPYIFDYFGADIKTITDTQQIQAGFILIRKSKKTVDFIEQWLEACEDPTLLFPLSENENCGICISHREDQSIFSVLCKINGIKTHRDPTQYGRIPEKNYEVGRLFKIPQHNDNYPTIIVLHRSASLNLKTLLKQWICSWLPVSLLYQFTERKPVK